MHRFDDPCEVGDFESTKARAGDVDIVVQLIDAIPGAIRIGEVRRLNGNWPVPGR
jgi:hypothetical protein